MNNRFPNRRWCIINSGDATSVNYNQVLESAAATLRYSIDGSKTFVKYNVTEYPVIQGYGQSGNVQYGDNVDSAGNTYNMYYEQEKTYYPLYSPEGDRSTVTGSGFHWTDVQPLAAPKSTLLKVPWFPFPPISLQAFAAALDPSTNGVA